MLFSKGIVLKGTVIKKYLPFGPSMIEQPGTSGNPWRWFPNFLLNFILKKIENKKWFPTAPSMTDHTVVLSFPLIPVGQS